MRGRPQGCSPPKGGPASVAKNPKGFCNLLFALLPPKSKLQKLAKLPKGRFLSPHLTWKEKKQVDLRTAGCYLQAGVSILRATFPPQPGLPFAPRYLISLGADREAANDDGDLPSDLIDPEFKDLVELFKGTKMD